MKKASELHVASSPTCRAQQNRDGTASASKTADAERRQRPKGNEHPRKGQPAQPTPENHEGELQKMRAHYEAKLVRMNALEVRYQAAREQQETTLNRIKQLEDALQSQERKNAKIQAELEQQRKRSAELSAQLENTSSHRNNEIALTERFSELSAPKRCNESTKQRAPAVFGEDCVHHREALEERNTAIAQLEKQILFLRQVVGNFASKELQSRTPSKGASDAATEPRESECASLREKMEGLARHVQTIVDGFTTVTANLEATRRELADATRSTLRAEREKALALAELTAIKASVPQKPTLAIPSRDLREKMKELDAVTERALKSVTATRNAFMTTASPAVDYEERFCESIQRLCEELRLRIAASDDEMDNTLPLNGNSNTKDSSSESSSSSDDNHNDESLDREAFIEEVLSSAEVVPDSTEPRDPASEKRKEERGNAGERPTTYRRPVPGPLREVVTVTTLNNGREDESN